MGKAKQILAVALAAALLCLSACGQVKDSSKNAAGQNKTDSNDMQTGNYVTLKAITLGQLPENGMDEFYEELDAMTEELGCHLRFDYIPWGDERSQLNMAIASGEYDFISNGNFSDYYQQAAKGAFLNLNDYREVAPELFAHYESYREDYLTNMEWNGGLYGIPQFNRDTISDTGSGFFYRADLLDDWNLPEVTDFDSMQQYLYAAKADGRYRDEALITDNRVWNVLWYLNSENYKEIGTLETLPYAVADRETCRSVISRFETPEFRQMLDVLHQWYVDGILNPGILASLDNEGLTALEMMQADEKPCETNAPIWTVNGSYVPTLYRKHPEWTYGFFSYQMNSGNITKRKQGKEVSCISISSKCREPEMAVKLLEKLHTDEKFYTLIRQGVSGIHYEMKDGVVSHENIPEENSFSYWIGCVDFTMEQPEYMEDKQWGQEYQKLQKRTEELLETAPDDLLMDFTWEDDGLKEIESRLEEVRRDYLLPLCCGVSDNIEEDYQTAIQKLYEAGLQQYLDILQQQLDAYWEEQS